MEKKTSGRKKIEMMKIKKTSNRLVAFSKRRPSVFNKASELCVLTGAEMAILVQSEGGRVFAFGNPSADSVIDTYLGNNNSNSSPVSEDLTCMYKEYNKEYEKICKELEVEKNKSNNVEESEGYWWEKSFENLEVGELEIFINSLEHLKLNVTKKADQLRNLSTSSSSDNIIDGLLDDQGILSDLDEFLPNNVGVANEDLMMPAVNYNSNDFDNYNCENGELVLDNPDDKLNDGVNDLQVQGDFGTFEIPDDLYFGQDQVQSDLGTFGFPDDLYFGHDQICFGVHDDLYFGHDQI